MIDHPATPRLSCATLLRAIAVAVLGAALLPAQGWRQLSPAVSPSARNANAFAFDEARGRAVLFGGSDGVTPVLGDTWEWDGASWLPRTTSVSPSPRSGHRMVYDPVRRRAVVFGGYSPTGGFLADTWEWDGTTWTLRNTPTAPSARGNYGMAFDRARAKTVLFGGFAGAQIYLSDTWTWDGTTWSLVPTSSRPAARRDPAMVYDSLRQVIVLFGGGTSAVVDDTWEWNGAQWTLRNALMRPSPRWPGPCVFDTARGKVQMFGGATANFSTNFDDTWEWDGGVSWHKLGSGPSGRHGHGMIHDSWRSSTVLFGGRGALAFRADTWEIPPASCTWSLQTTTGPSPRTGAAMAYEGTAGMILLFGGIYDVHPMPWPILGDTWRWNGAWQAVAAPGPPARAHHRMVYDSQRNRIVMFGGHNQSFAALGDTWEWNGAVWTPIAGAHPPARASHGMAYDASRSRVVVFGGGSNDTWEYDGATWQQRTPTQAPPVRYQHAMAYDPQRGRTVLHGGYYGTALNDTWEWDGATWTFIAGPGPGFLYDHAMTFDPARNRLVLFGGIGVGSYYYDDTWERSGTTWTQVATHGPERIRHAIANDGQRSIVFGGRVDYINVVGDTWATVPASATMALARPYGLGCGTPALALLADPQAQPILGTTPRATIPNAPAALAFVAMGSNRTSFAGLPIPVSLASYGMPGCDLLQSADLGAVFGTTAAGASGLQFQLPLANVPALLGLQLFLQAWAPAPGANAAGVIVSNGLEWRLGNI